MENELRTDNSPRSPVRLQEIFDLRNTSDLDTEQFAHALIIYLYYHELFSRPS